MIGVDSFIQIPNEKENTVPILNLTCNCGNRWSHDAMREDIVCIECKKETTVKEILRTIYFRISVLRRNA